MAITDMDAAEQPKAFTKPGVYLGLRQWGAIQVPVIHQDAKRCDLVSLGVAMREKDWEVINMSVERV